MRKFAAIILILSMLFGLTVTASAVVAPSIQPLYNHTNSIYAALSIDETLGIATCYGKVSAKSFVPAKVVVQLQQNVSGNWVTLKTWTNTGTYSAAYTGTHAIYRGYTYCVKVTGYVYDANGVLQEISSNSHTVVFP